MLVVGGTVGGGVEVWPIIAWLATHTLTIGHSPLIFMREVQDHYFREAKREGYLSRAAYKLIEIDDRKRILRAGDFVLDCGAAPGSWLQVANGRVGPSGVVVGIDLQSIKHCFHEGNVRFLQGDFTTTPAAELLQSNRGSLFDVILSDMAPNTTGDPSGDHFRSVRLCDSLLDRCGELLRAGGKLVMKVFEGEAYPELLKRAQREFEATRGYKPKASRSESTEMYIVATGYRSAPPADDDSDDELNHAPPKRKPSAGWQT